MSRPPLPILTTVAETYRLLLADFLTFLHAAAGWSALSLAMQVALFSLAHNEGQRTMAMIVGLVVFLIAGVALAVTWHRRILLQEAPRGPLPIRLDVVPRYLAAVGVILAITTVGGAVIGTTLWFMPPNVLTLAVMLAVYVVAFLAIGRLLLLLPAAAIGERRMTLRAAWAFTVRNSWRLFAGLSLSAVPLILISVLITAGLGERMPLLAAAVSLALSFANTALIAGFASFAYRHFTETAQLSTFS